MQALTVAGRGPAASLEKMLNPGVCTRLTVAWKRVVGAGRVAKGVGVQAEVCMSAVPCGRNLEVEQCTFGQVVGATDRIDGRIPAAIVCIDVIHRAYKCGRRRGWQCASAQSSFLGLDA